MYFAPKFQPGRLTPGAANPVLKTAQFGNFSYGVHTFGRLRRIRISHFVPLLVKTTALPSLTGAAVEF